MPRRMLLLAAGAALTLGCVTLHRPVPVDPEATFAAHQEHARLAIDRLARGRSGELRPAGWLRGPGDPAFVLVADGQEIAALWPSGDGVVVRGSTSREAPLVGEVGSSWDGGSIRLALRPAGGPAFRTDPFAREGGGTGPATLTRTAETVIDVRGTYRATVRDQSGTAVGWLRTRISPYQEASRIFDGALPAAIQPELAAAVATALNVEIDWIEDHAINVYRGSGGGPLEHSIPAPR